jgi:Fungal specific transcription factor domain
VPQHQDSTNANKAAAPARALVGNAKPVPVVVASKSSPEENPSPDSIETDLSEPHGLHEQLLDPSFEVPVDMFQFGTATTAFAVPPSLAMFDNLSAPFGGSLMTSDLDDLVDRNIHLPSMGESAESGPSEPRMFGPMPASHYDFDDETSNTMLNQGFVDPSLLDHQDDNVEEIVRTGFPRGEPERFTMRLPDFYSSGFAANAIPPGSELFPLLREPEFPGDSPEMLTVRFDRQTCGILSVKDGPTENPWRTMIWPLARDSPALYHAIASMTSFHMSKSSPALRMRGIEHMRTSIEALASGISEMKFETAIATTLALAFAESWDTHTSTGINHIKGANILVKQAIEWHRKRPFQGERLRSLQFLCNAWVYMDVIARLTSVDDDESTDFDVVFSKLTISPDEDTYLDPLMGAASTLFPIIGRVANLVRRVRRTQSNSPAMVSQAMELKRMLEDWVPTPIFENPEDPSSQPQDSLQTAEAYRWATLLYLHQAVPEIPSESSARLAKHVMVYLATVPLSSRTVIVQIYPLLAAGCEAVEEEDRQWVRERWMSMANRMKIGVIDRCADVVSEVWARRDAYELENQRKPPLTRGFSFDQDIGSELFDSDFKDLFAGRQRRATSGAFDLPRALRDSGSNGARRRSRDPATGKIDPEFTVKGRLHWLGVMSDWHWEGSYCPS